MPASASLTCSMRRPAVPMSCRRRASAGYAPLGEPRMTAASSGLRCARRQKIDGSRVAAGAAGRMQGKAGRHLAAARPEHRADSNPSRCAPEQLRLAGVQLRAGQHKAHRLVDEHDAPLLQLLLRFVQTRGGRAADLQMARWCPTARRGPTSSWLACLPAARWRPSAPPPAARASACCAPRRQSQMPRRASGRTCGRMHRPANEWHMTVAREHPASRRHPAGQAASSLATPQLTPC